MLSARICPGVMALATLVALANGQALPDSPHFDVVSVKPVQWKMGNSSLHSDTGRIDFHQVSLQEMLLRAWPVAMYQIVWPTPTWMQDKQAWYDVSATMPTDTTKDHLQLMWQSLLKERFGLQAHTETRPLPVYAVIVAPGGLKIHKANGAPFDPDAPYLGTMTTPTAFVLKGDMPVSRVVQDFFGYLDRPLVDMSGLDGAYSIDLSVPRDSVKPDPSIPFTQWTPEMRTAFNGWDSSWFFSAMEKQLGLKVEKRTIPTRMLIIDRLERVPTGN